MLVKREWWNLIAVNIASILFFTTLFVVKGNYEFLVYVVIVCIIMACVLTTMKYIKYPQLLLWGFTLWGILHFAGGGVYIFGEKLYGLMLFPLVPSLGIFRFDQLMHIYGFFLTAMALYYALKPRIKKKHWVVLSLYMVMGSMGFGALNEVVEFSATLLASSHGVGGYVNNALDLVFNLIGALLAWLLVQYKHKTEDRILTKKTSKKKKSKR